MYAASRPGSTSTTVGWIEPSGVRIQAPVSSGYAFHVLRSWLKT